MKVLNIVIAGHVKQEVIFRTTVQKMKKKRIKRFEPTPDIKDVVYYHYSVQVYQFKDIHSDENIYEQEKILNKEDYDGETESESN